MNIRVIRVGGSLLTWNAFTPTFQQWLSEQSCARNVLIAGGGPWVELLRQAAARFEIAEPDAHMLCVKAMQTTAALLAEVCDCPLVTRLDEVTKHNGSTVAFDVYGFLNEVDAKSPSPLPQSWAVTSDSIAARVANELGNADLILLKSADCPAENDRDLATLSKAGYVDEYFPIAAQGLNVQFVNLRSIS